MSAIVAVFFRESGYDRVVDLLIGARGLRMRRHGNLLRSGPIALSTLIRASPY